MELETYEELLEIDEDDKKILQLLQENCDITHKDISEKINKSQPAVGARILKLERRELLLRKMGLNYKNAKLTVARIRVQTSNSKKFWDRFSKCPYIMSLLRIIGEYDAIVEIVAPNIQTTEHFIDVCLREDKNVKKLESTYIIDSAFDYLLKVNFKFQNFLTQGCNVECREGLTQEDLERLLKERELE